MENRDSLQHDIWPELEAHDGHLQALYGVALQMEHCIHLISESPEEAVANLSRSLTDVRRLIGILRERIEETRRNMGLDGPRRWERIGL